MSASDVASTELGGESVVIVYSTAPTREIAGKIADAVVQERLAACVNIVPGMTSVYRWNGAIQHDTEIVLLCKTVRSRVSELEAKVKSLHPYDCPCVMTLPVVAGSEQFLSWVKAETRL